MIEVVNQIRKIGETLTDEKVVEKVLRSFSKKFDHVVAAIEESKDLKVLTVAELLGSLLSHEERIKRYDDQPVENAFLSKEKSNGSQEFDNKGPEGHFSHGK